MARVKVAELLGHVLRGDGRGLHASFALSKENGVSPIDVARLAIACEQAYRVTLRDEDVSEWRTLGDAEAHIARLLDAGDAEPAERSDEERTAWFYQ